MMQTGRGAGKATVHRQATHPCCKTGVADQR